MSTPLNYRHGVGIVLARSAQEVFVGKRLNSSAEAWQMPQGGVDPEEEIISAMWRELAEETGVHSEHAQIIAQSDWLSYEIPKPLRETLWQGRYIGQRQKWFLLKFHAQDQVISLENPGAPPEFDSWKWVPFQGIHHLAVDFKRQLYLEIQNKFSSIIHKTNPNNTD